MFASQEDRKLIVTHTGEPTQPTRLYYRVLNQQTLVRALNKLRCIHYVPHLDIWQWLYENEAKKALHFDISYNKIPKDQRPIALAWLFLRGDDLIIDVRSCERALKAIEFFDARINRRAAQVYKMRVVNRFFSSTEPNIIDVLETPYDHFFDDRDDEVVRPKGDELIEELEAIKAQYEDEDEQEEAISDYLSQDLDKPSPELEEIPIHFYEEGISGLYLALTTRRLEAQARWHGDRSFSKMDLIMDFAERMAEEIWEEDDEVEAEGDNTIEVEAIEVSSSAEDDEDKPLEEATEATSSDADE